MDMDKLSTTLLYKKRLPDIFVSDTSKAFVQINHEKPFSVTVLMSVMWLGKFGHCLHGCLLGEVKCKTGCDFGNLITKHLMCAV